MEVKLIEEALSGILELREPWYIEKVDVHHKNAVVDIYIRYKRGSKFKCSKCGKNCSVYDSNYRRWRHLNIFQYRCYLNVQIPRTDCKQDGVLVIDSIPWGRMGTHYSYLFEATIMRLCAEMSVSGLSAELGEPDTNLWRVFNYYINKAIKEQISCATVKRISVDETSDKKGHSYVTIFTDMDTGDVIRVYEGRKQDVFKSLSEWFFSKEIDVSQVEHFCMDMSKSYKAGREEYFPRSQVIFDKFHIKKALNEAVNKVRKQEAREVVALKKTKYLWLKNEKNLSYKEEQQLNTFLLESTYDTTKAYQLKIGFDEIWKVQPLAVEKLLNNWMECALLSKLHPIEYFVGTVKRNLKGIINAMKTGITNAVAEGINSIVQMAKSRARGFRNIDNFKSMIYYLGNDFKLFTH